MKPVYINWKLKTSRAPPERQAPDTCLFTSAASIKSKRARGSQGRVPTMVDSELKDGGSD